MNKLPKIAVFILFILLIGVLISLVIGGGLIFTAHDVNEYGYIKGTYIRFDPEVFRWFFGIVIVVGFGVGCFFVGFQRAWTIEQLIQRIDNPRTADFIDYALMERRHEMGWKRNYDIVIKNNSTIKNKGT